MIGLLALLLLLVTSSVAHAATFKVIVVEVERC